MKRIGLAIIVCVGLVSAGFAQAPPKVNFFQKGMEHYNKGEYDAAIESFKKVVNQTQMQGAQAKPNPKKADAFFFIGMSMRKKDNLDGAAANFSNAIEIRPAYAQALAARGDVYAQQKKWDLAAADLVKVKELQPDNVQAQYQLGMAYAWQERFQDAVNVLSHVVEVNPQHAYAHYWLGMSYYKIKDYTKMINHLEAFLQLAPDAPEAVQVKEILTQIQG
jgi:tetratricopeptide (TPR) repeat protein